MIHCKCTGMISPSGRSVNSVNDDALNIQVNICRCSAFDLENWQFFGKEPMHKSANYGSYSKGVWHE